MKWMHINECYKRINEFHFLVFYLFFTVCSIKCFSYKPISSRFSLNSVWRIHKPKLVDDGRCCPNPATWHCENGSPPEPSPLLLTAAPGWGCYCPPRSALLYLLDTQPLCVAWCSTTVTARVTRSIPIMVIQPELITAHHHHDHDPEPVPNSGRVGR